MNEQREKNPRARNLEDVLARLNERAEEVCATLPPDMPFEKFIAVVNQALRNNPDLLDCTPASIVRACLKSAYDGLRVDGREAAIVSHNVKVSRNPDKWEKQAQYFPMVFGLVQQILRGGMVTAIEAEVIYEGDDYRVLRGTNPGIHHEPLLIGDRGKPIAAYSVATFPDGTKSTLLMRADEIIDVQSVSKSGWKDGKPIAKSVWDRWWSEMWKKTVVRRHRKTLPVGRDIVDVEARDEFPQFDRTEDRSALPPPRPTRQPAALRHQPGTAGAPLDLGEQREREMVEVEHDRDGVVIEGAANAGAETAEPEVEIPEDAAAWAVWEKDLETKIAAAKTAAAVNALWRDARAVLEANADVNARLAGVFSDRLAAIATGE